ncbi:MAG: hypothetical protein Q9183_000796 [Haloplaca sp. 2 TL-2023]
MPSWSSRLRHPPLTNHGPQATRAGVDSSIKGDLDVDTTYSAPPRGIDVTDGSRSQSSRHGRSLSHPLSSMLGYGKKADNLDSNEVGGSYLTSPDGVPLDPSKVDPLDMEVGKCATCDSTVQWPKHLSVFRCTICLMVNELSLMKGPKCNEEEQKRIGAKDNGRANRQSVFQPLEDYIIGCFRNGHNLNGSFAFPKAAAPIRSVSEGTLNAPDQENRTLDSRKPDGDAFELDAKTLLLADVAENGTWWLGRFRADMRQPQQMPVLSDNAVAVQATSRIPRINFAELHKWYASILTAGHDWRAKLSSRVDGWRSRGLLTLEKEAAIDAGIEESRLHLRRTLLKASESLLRRPGLALQFASNCRFLLLLAANPLLYPIRIDSQESRHGIGINDGTEHNKPQEGSKEGKSSHHLSRGTANKHTGIIKRILGLMANLSQDAHRQLIGCFSRFPDDDFRNLVELVGGFVTYRLLRQRRSHHMNHSRTTVSTLVPELSGYGAGTSAQLHAALGGRTKSAHPESPEGAVGYHDDWQIKAAAKVMSLLFVANNNHGTKSPRHATKDADSQGHPLAVSYRISPHTGQVSNQSGRESELLLPTSAFYNTLLDYCDLVADFEMWEKRSGSFSFCQYPMFLSIWAKIRVLEHDARRQMEIKARQAFFSSILSRRAISQYFVLRVRRECLVEDSLRGVSEVVGSGEEDIKKGLRIAFEGEEGIDAGGLRKEWFLLLIREVFDPEHGLFVYDEDSRYCYFNPDTFETSDQFFLVGVVLGLAIYNSTILDIALPPFVFRKLLASAPSYTGPAISVSRPTANHTLSDLAEFRPSLASGLQRLLEYEGNVEETFCHDFVIEIDRYGQPRQVPLCPRGASRAVTNANRAEFVDLYVKYLLETSVSRQFEPFKRGFFSVCGGNALSLFRPEEIELLIRGSDEALDVATLQAVAIYDGWNNKTSAEDESVVTWFWDLFSETTSKKQRALLSFITGSDRLPATGATSLIIKITCLGDDHERFPIARTCFNMIGLYRYSDKKTLESKLWRAVAESEGFGLR